MPNLENKLDLERCPHCGVDRPHLQIKTDFATTTYDGHSAGHWAVYACDRCGGAVLARASKSGYPICDCFPGEVSLNEAIPERAREYLDQGIRALSTPVGAIMLAASSVDSMLKEKGYVDGALYSRINQAVEDHLITQEMAEWAHTIRLDANNQRHSDDSVPLPEVEDAKRVVEFTRSLALFLFELPSRINQGIRDAKTGAPGQS